MTTPTDSFCFHLYFENVRSLDFCILLCERLDDQILLRAVLNENSIIPPSEPFFYRSFPDLWGYFFGGYRTGQSLNIAEHDCHISLL